MLWQKRSKTKKTGFNRFKSVRLPVASNQATKTVVAVAGCPFLGPKTGPDRTRPSNTSYRSLFWCVLYFFFHFFWLLTYYSLDNHYLFTWWWRRWHVDDEVNGQQQQLQEFFFSVCFLLLFSFLLIAYYSFR